MKGFFRSLTTHFIRGLLVVVPLAVSIYVVWTLFQKIDTLILIPGPGGLEKIPGLGLVVVVIGVTLVGYFTTFILTRRLFRALDRLVQRIPLVELLYSSIKDLLGAFVGEKKRFDQPVMVSLTEKAPGRLLGFVTRENLTCLGLPGWVSVYFPQSYNFAGQTILFPRESVMPLDADPTEILQFIVSGGISGFEDFVSEGEKLSGNEATQTPSP